MKRTNFMPSAKLAEISVPLISWLKKLGRTLGSLHDCSNELRKPQLLVDVSVIYGHDSRTGIQRVVRAVWLQLCETVPVGFDLVAVAATRSKVYRVVPSNFLEMADRPSISALPKVTRRSLGDIFFGLDLAAHIVPRRASELLRWQRDGCQLTFMVYDLLPVQNPQWFNDKLARNFQRWLSFVGKNADRMLCISQTVAANLANWVEGNVARSHPRVICSVRLGGNLSVSAPSSGLTEGERRVLRHLEANPTLLCVGTIEPRKGHSTLLDAFELLSANDGTCNLVVVGRPGWKTAYVQDRMRALQKDNPRFFWFSDASDELLVQLYQQCSLVIVPSIDEGFGLPIVEARQYGCPVLARDISVFRELSGPGIHYFPGDDIEGLLERIRSLSMAERSDVRAEASPRDWAQCVSEIMDALNLRTNPNTS